MASRRCDDCGHLVSESARFCERCGSALSATARPLRAPSSLEGRILRERTGIEGERKQVTVMYADIVGSMALTRSLDNERYGYVLDRFLALAAAAVHAFEGTVNQFTGDGLLAVFGAPLAHEDHARRACLAVLELQAEVAGLAAQVRESDGVALSVRCGVNSGEVVVGAIGDDVQMDFVPIGNTTALGKRIESLAPAGSAAVSAATAALVEGEFELRVLGEFELKGAEGRERVFELLGPGAARSRIEAIAATRGLSRFVGRDAELGELESALGRALRGEGQAVGIVGEPGVGKSRLVREFAARCVERGVTVSGTSAFAHGRYVPFLPMLALYRDYFGIDERDAPETARGRIETRMLTLDPSFAADLPLLFEFLGVTDPGRPPAALDAQERRQRLLDLLTRTVEARSRHEAFVVVVEDLHWIDEASAEFVEHLAATVSATRTIIVCTFRPEYEARWAGPRGHAEVRLAPLDPGAAGALLTELLGEHASLEGLAALIEARTSGNPFFIEEIVQALAENGHLTGPRGGYRLGADLDGIVLPPTVEAGLAARIDQLPVAAKTLVQTMSVIGTEIPGQLLSEVSDLTGDPLADAVDVLASAQLVIPDEASGGPGYVFKHPLTQDVAYASQLSERRARTHRAVAVAIARLNPDALDERAALLAHHFEAAGDALESARWHTRAAAWAKVAAPAEAMRHWRRVRRLVVGLGESPENEELAANARLGILSLAWRVGASPDEVAEIRAEVDADSDGGPADLWHAGSLMHSGREHDGLEKFRETYQAAMTIEDYGLALTAATGVAYASWIAGALDEGVGAIDRALAATGDDPAIGAGLAFICPLAHAHGHRGMCRGYTGDLGAARVDFERALELARRHDDRETVSASHANLAMLEAVGGDTEAAFRQAELGLAIAEPSGNVIHAIACTVPVAVAAAAEGRFGDALAEARSNLATIREHGIGLYYEAVLLATMARCQLEAGRPAAALAAAEEAFAIANARGLGTCALQAPIVLARVLAATEGAAAAGRIAAALDRAEEITNASGARLFTAQLEREREALALLS